ARVSPQRYLADSSAAVAAVNDFSEALAELAPTPRRPALLAAAPRLEDALDRTVAIAGRIEAQRLEDRRLEEQRARASAALDAVITEMSLVADAATAGDPIDMAASAGRYASSVADLRILTAP
ncbi:MAG: hypothetical protein JHC74_15795, partial [Thermoleophilia bacterium]|nr:hypothetical protein [Thermoleophilia bacterium]